MVGGAGNDTYVVDAAGDTVTEAANAGTDSVTSSINHTLGLNVENLTLTGTAAITAPATSLGNTLTGNAGDKYAFRRGGERHPRWRSRGRHPRRRRRQ